MAIFSNNNDFSSDVVACEGYDIALGGGYDAIMESYDDDQAVIEAMHAYDMAELEAMKESGSTTPKTTSVMEASLKDIWAKIKTWFKNMFARIMAFFKSAIAYLDSIMMSGKAFATKYGERLSKLHLAGFSYEMYDYKVDMSFSKDIGSLDDMMKDTDELMTSIANVSFNAGDANEKFLKLKETYEALDADGLKELRKKLSGEESAEKFSEALTNKFRGGDKKKSVGVTNVQPYVNFLKATDNYSKYAKKANDMVKGKFTKMEQNINKAASEAEKVKDTDNTGAGAKKAALMRSCLTYNSSVQSILTRYINSWSSAVKEATGVYKNLCFKAMSYKPAK